MQATQAMQALSGKAATAAVTRPGICSSASPFLGAPAVHRIPAGCRVGRQPREKEVQKGFLAVRAAEGEADKAGREPWDFGRFLNTVLYFNPLEEVSRARQALSGEETGGRRWRPKTLEPGRNIDVARGAGFRQLDLPCCGLTG